MSSQKFYTGLPHVGDGNAGARQLKSCHGLRHCVLFLLVRIARLLLASHRNEYPIEEIKQNEHGSNSMDIFFQHHDDVKIGDIIGLHGFPGRNSLFQSSRFCISSSIPSSSIHSSPQPLLFLFPSPSNSVLSFDQPLYSFRVR